VTLQQADPSERVLISICVPVLNEQDNIGPFHDRLTSVLAGLEEQYAFEILFTDNHSEDDTFARLVELSGRDPRVRVIRFSRNFGFQRSILTNYNNCRGQAAIQIDVDLQDPPELIVEFLRLWRDGYQVVYGVRRGRPNEHWALFRARRMFYRLVDFLSEDRLPHDAGDFRLIDRCILDQLRSSTDQQPYLRGMIAAMGFRQVGLVYDRTSRMRGHSKFDFWRLLRLAVDGILHHSIIPLQLAMIVGIAVFLLAFAGTIYFVVAKIFFRTDWPVGLASLHVLILLSMGLNAIFLGIIGEYLGRIFKNVKQTPLTIVEAVVDHAGLTGIAQAKADAGLAYSPAGKVPL
jgi:dolichol-phosphate mannosyltransferase